MHCTPSTYTMLYVNYIPIKLEKQTNKRYREKIYLYRPRRETSEETNPADNLDLRLLSSTTVRNKFLCLSRKKKKKGKKHENSKQYKVQIIVFT